MPRQRTWKETLEISFATIDFIVTINNVTVGAFANQSDAEAFYYDCCDGIRDVHLWVIDYDNECMVKDMHTDYEETLARVIGGDE